MTPALWVTVRMLTLSLILTVFLPRRAREPEAEAEKSAKPGQAETATHQRQGMPGPDKVR